MLTIPTVTTTSTLVCQPLLRHSMSFPTSIRPLTFA
jgi:hypothetical protein